MEFLCQLISLVSCPSSLLSVKTPQFWSSLILRPGVQNIPHYDGTRKDATLTVSTASERPRQWLHPVLVTKDIAAVLGLEVWKVKYRKQGIIVLGKVESTKLLFILIFYLQVFPSYFWRIFHYAYLDWEHLLWKLKEPDSPLSPLLEPPSLPPSKAARFLCGGMMPTQWQEISNTVVANHRAWGKWSSGMVQVRLAAAGLACLLLPGHPLFYPVCPTFPMTQWATPFLSNKFRFWFQSVSAPIAYN